jgi:predicted kinase
MSKLIIMCGIPGSGKSTWLHEHAPSFSAASSIISRDDIRFSMLKDGEDYFAHEKEVWTQFIEDIVISLAINEETYVDATHINERSRAKLLRALNKNLYGVEVQAVFFNTPLDIALARNENRSGLAYVPASAIITMHSNLTEPTFIEGFSKIYIVENNKLYQKVELQDD